MPTPQNLPRHSLHWLIFAALATVILWQIPGADLALYPFAILATWFHEVAHGLAAIVMGGDFQRLELHPDASGVATYTYSPGPLAAFGRAFIAAAGPLGPAIAGALFILAGRHQRSAGVGLGLLAAMLLISVLLWIRDPFGMIAVALWGGAILLVLWKGSVAVRAFSIQFLGIQACVSCYRQIGYLFSGEASIGGRLMQSDTMQIQQQLLLPYWFWGALIILLSMAMLFGALWVAYADASQGRRPKLLITR